jgi:hypothetical protein
MTGVLLQSPSHNIAYTKLGGFIPMKKHFSQMSPKEVKYLTERFKSIPQHKWSFNTYSKKRAINRGVDLGVMRTLWTDGFDLIEFHKHDDSGENRVLLRTTAVDSKDNQVCAVFNFTKMEITTVYLNWRLNKHDNLVWSEYDKTLDVKQLMKAR